jgi:prolyl-tRNA synthetase
MKDAYSFDIDAAGLDKSFDLHDEVYRRIFTRCGLKFVAVEAHSGSMGGSQSREFMVYTEAGEDLVASCDKCGYAANLEKATSRLESIEELAPTGDGKPELVYTPGKGAIEDVAAFLNVSPNQDIKSVAYMAQRPSADGKMTLEQPVVAFLRGDHTVSETKLATLVKASELRPMRTEELEQYFQGPAGYLGPMGLTPRPAAQLGSWESQSDRRSLTVVVDLALEGRKNMICGANKEDYHFRNVTPGRDFQWTVLADIRNVIEGEGCPNCGAPLKLGKAVEVGHIFKLGYKYSESMGARVLDKDGKEVTPIMGSYGIGIERILTSCIEQNHDENGFWLPPEIAPFQVVVVPTNVSDEKLAKAAEEIAQQLEKAGFDVLIDDRDERPGVKFKDADLVGIPVRINVGKKLTEGKVEVIRRSTRESVDANISAICEIVGSLVSSETYA